MLGTLRSEKRLVGFVPVSGFLKNIKNGSDLSSSEEKDSILLLGSLSQRSGVSSSIRSVSEAC